MPCANVTVMSGALKNKHKTSENLPIVQARMFITISLYTAGRDLHISSAGTLKLCLQWFVYVRKWKMTFATVTLQPSFGRPMQEEFVGLTSVLLDQQKWTDDHPEQPKGYWCFPAVRSLLFCHTSWQTVPPAIGKDPHSALESARKALRHQNPAKSVSR